MTEAIKKKTNWKKKYEYLQQVVATNREQYEELLQENAKLEELNSKLHERNKELEQKWETERKIKTALSLRLRNTRGALRHMAHSMQELLQND